MNGIRVIQPSDPVHASIAAALDAARRSEGRYDYTPLVRAYNSAELSGIVHLDFPRRKVPGLVAQLKVRGLNRDEDYALVISTADGTDEDGNPTEVEQISLTRLTKKAGQEGYTPRNRRPMTPEQKDQMNQRRLATLKKNRQAAVKAAQAQVVSKKPAKKK